MGKLKTLIADLREDIGIPDLPFIVGQVYYHPETKPHTKEINDLITKILDMKIKELVTSNPDNYNDLEVTNDIAGSITGNAETVTFADNDATNEANEILFTLQTVVSLEPGEISDLVKISYRE